MITNKNNSNLVWMDLEGTGLDFPNVEILEVSLVITDKNLNILNKGTSITVKQSTYVLENMSEWCKETFLKNGLTKRVRESKTDIEEMQKTILEEIQEYVGENESPLCGNSVHYDRSLLFFKAPKIINYLTHRNIDVSSIKELRKRWAPEMTPPEKKSLHTALDDIYESIDELKFYRKHIFSI